MYIFGYYEENDMIIMSDEVRMEATRKHPHIMASFQKGIDPNQTQISKHTILYDESIPFHVS